MLPDFAKGSPLWEAVFALIVLGASLLVALSLHPALTRVVKFFTQRTRTKLDDLLLEAISRPLFIFILVQGAFLALTTISYLDRWQGSVNKAWIVLAGGVGIYGVQRVIAALLQWYAEEVATRTGGPLDDKLVPLVRRFLTVSAYAVGGLLILDNVGIKLSPLLAGLGLGGLAVALALQPTLSNLIASAYMVADGIISVGDFIELQGGPSGTVLEVGWRSTKIQTPINNLVVVPNSKLADSVVTNYTKPTPETGIFVTCGVSYESDLQRVQAVALEVATQLREGLPDTVVDRKFEPLVLFREFGDSNITFFVVMRASDRIGTFTLQHELVKRLHARFTREGIEINYPVRKLVFPRGDGASKASASLDSALRGEPQSPHRGGRLVIDNGEDGPETGR